MEWTTTSTLLTRLEDYRQQDAWSGLIERFRPALLAAARRVGLSPDTAEDATQAALLRFATAYREGRFDKSRGSLRSWLFTIASRVAIDHLREERRRDSRVKENDDAGRPPEELAVDPGTEETYETEWKRWVLNTCMKQARSEFSERSWAVFESFALSSKSAEEVAQSFGMTRHAVYLTKHRVMRRLAALREKLETEC